ncbi:MAG TPA: ABC transporter ATP-binding protein [Pseudonocardiaceae bacterium]
MKAVEIHGLTKSFGSTRALDGLDLALPAGQVLGFLGPNGSGKTTTIRILLGLLRADGGEVRVLGGDPWRQAVELHRRLVYVPGEVSLWPNLTGGQIIDLLGRASGGIEDARRADMIEWFDLDTAKKARAYSKGNRQKVALVAALASRADLLILDEPTSGLDPIMEMRFTEAIRHVRDEGRSVLLSSHIFSEVEKLADQVCIIRAGRTVEQGTLSEMRHLTGTHVTATVDGDASAVAALAGVYDFREDNGRISFTVDSGRLGTALTALGPLNPRNLTANPPSLEELFLSHYGEDNKQGRTATRAEAAV